ncbi:MAG: 1-acyl-sn-glycerol-3-phosphate acyltransferase [Lachnospiraceae bacterium]|nr:1-acyl-sn-glycerol-3-phosphate acyltransferase [Lachnospiraceae bacterium]
MLRFIGDALFTIIFLILSIPVIAIEGLIRLVAPKASAKSSQAIVTRAFRIVAWIAGVKLTVKGLENIPKDTAVLYVPNHRSIFDIIITYYIMPGQTGYVAKKETGRFPVFNLWMALMNCQFLDRKDLRKGLKVILRCCELIKEGTSITIFPEGTRNKGSEDIQPFHDGSFKIAEKTGCPIVPIAINNTDQIFEAQFPKIKSRKVVIEFCQPIKTEGLSRAEFKEVSNKVKAEILEAYRRNKELVK